MWLRDHITTLHLPPRNPLSPTIVYCAPSPLSFLPPLSSPHLEVSIAVRFLGFVNWFGFSWAFHFSILSPFDSFHVAASPTVSLSQKVRTHLYFYKWIVFHCAYIPHFSNLLSVLEDLGCSYNMTMVNNAAGNMGVGEGIYSF